MVLRLFLDSPQAPRTVEDLVTVTGLSKRNLYRILAQLTEAGWLARRKDDIGPRPRRGPRGALAYTLAADPAAIEAATQYVARLRAQNRLLDPPGGPAPPPERAVASAGNCSTRRPGT